MVRSQHGTNPFLQELQWHLQKVPQKLRLGFPASQSGLVICRYVKAAATALLILALVTAAANVWCVGSINRRYIPQACAQAETVLERKVSHFTCCGVQDLYLSRKNT